jgi:hypothetical protein
MGLDIAADLCEIELGQRRVVGAGARDQHVIDRRAQLAEEPLQPVEVGGVEGGHRRLELGPDAAEPVRIARGEDQGRAFGTRAPGRLQADAGTASDHDDGLPGELRSGAHVASSAHDSRKSVACRTNESWNWKSEPWPASG